MDKRRAVGMKEIEALEALEKKRGKRVDGKPLDFDDAKGGKDELESPIKIWARSGFKSADQTRANKKFQPGSAAQKKLDEALKK